MFSSLSYHLSNHTHPSPLLLLARLTFFTLTLFSHYLFLMPVLITFLPDIL
jgi:hypothetical protein